MLTLIFENNKEVLKKDDYSKHLSTLKKLFDVSRNHKTMFEPIAKKIKTISIFLLKNQLNLKNSDKFEDLSDFLITLLK